jgi:hypothetical protein
MGMSAWGILAAPLLAHAPAPSAETAAMEARPPTVETDIFGALSPMDDGLMSAASGGADTAIDIADFGLNIADNDGSVNEINVNNSDTGKIADNVVSGNGGITTVFNNTGNGVIFQNNVNVNIFLNDGAGN